MRHVWFKACYVATILAGEKTSTIRAKHPHLEAGQEFAMSVGPKRPFAKAIVESVEQLTLDDLSEKEREGVATIYEGMPQTFWRLTFRLTG